MKEDIKLQEREQEHKRGNIYGKDEEEEME